MTSAAAGMRWVSASPFPGSICHEADVGKVERHGPEALTPPLQFTLDRVFARTVDTIGDILIAHDDAQSIATAFELFWRFQLSGLRALLNPRP